MCRGQMKYYPDSLSNPLLILEQPLVVSVTRRPLGKTSTGKTCFLSGIARIRGGHRHQICRFFEHCSKSLWPPRLRFEHVANFFDGFLKKRVNVCCDKKNCGSGGGGHPLSKHKQSNNQNCVGFFPNIPQWFQTSCQTYCHGRQPKVGGRSPETHCT